jgi:hypothetical protein
MYGQAISAGANIVGGTMQAIAASQAQKAMEAALQAEINRQSRFRQEGLSVLTPAIVAMGVENARKLMTEGEQGRQKMYETVGNVPFGLFTPTLVDQTKLKLLGDLRAKLGGYADWQNQQGIDQLHTQQQLNRIFDKSAGQSALFPYRMNDAQHSWDELAFWGQLIQSIGGSAGNWQQAFGQGPQGMGTTQFSPGFGGMTIQQPGSTFVWTNASMDPTL